MKTLALILSVLLVVTVVYGFDKTRSQNFQSSLKKCAEDQGVPADSPTPDVLLCALKVDGKLLNEKGEYNKEAAISGYADVISDQESVAKAQEMFNACDAEATQKGLTGDARTQSIATCSLPTLAFFDKS